MRKDFKNRKILRGVKVCYEVVGLNQDRLIEELKKRNFTLYDVKKLSNRVMHICVNLAQSDNFFAITKNLCYNVKKLRLLGKGLPVYKLLTNFGLAVGTLIFTLLTVLANDYVLSFSYSGSGAVYKWQIEQYLISRGIDKYSKFSSFEIDRLEDEILSQTPNLTFVSLRKRGNTLEVYSTLKTDKIQLDALLTDPLISKEKGVVESVKVYRGTAVVKVGDCVEVGDVLVENYVEIKERRVQTGALAYVTLLSEYEFNYVLNGRDSEGVALALAGEEFLEREIVSSTVTVTELSGEKDRFIYTVKATYRTVVRSG